MLKFVIIAVLSLQAVYAANFVKGKGSFYATDDDSLGFVKEQLTHNGFVDVISKELEAMGLNQELFWQKYDKEFATVFDRVDDALKQKYNITKNPSKSEREAYRKTARKRKLKMKRSFGRLSSVVQSYSTKKISRSPQNPANRYIRLEAKVDRTLLTKIYYQFVRGKRSSDYGTLYVHVDYNLKDLTFAELGVMNDKDFTEAVNSNWLKWFSANKPKNIANVEMLTGPKLKELRAYLKLPYEQMLKEIPEMFINSLYLRIEINIEKLKKDEEFSQYVFAYDGGMFLQDLQNAQMLTSFQFDHQVKSYPLVEKSKLSTLVANYVYRMPFAHFSKLNNSIKGIPPMTGIQRVALFDYKNISDVYSLMELLESRGIKYSLRPRLESIGNGRAELVLFYDGRLPEIKTLIQGLQSAKSSLSFDFIDTDTVLGIKFNKLNQKEAKI